jgi:hypothetical protein
LEAEGPSPPILNETYAEQANMPGLMDEATTPESEAMDAKLPVLKRDKEADIQEEVMRMEIPDSEDVSEFSSPVKVYTEGEEKRNTGLQGDCGLQTVEDGQKDGIESEGGAIGEKNVTRLEIPDSEEASKFSSPVKVDMGVQATHDGALQEIGGLETIGDRKEQGDEQEDATMMDVSVPVHGEGVGGCKGSRAVERFEVDRLIVSAAEKLESADTEKEMEYALDRDAGVSPARDDGHIAGALSKEIQGAPSADKTLNTAVSKIYDQEASPAGAIDGAFVYQAILDKGEGVEVTGLPARTDGSAEQGGNSSVYDVEGIVIAAQKLLSKILFNMVT